MRLPSAFLFPLIIAGSIFIRPAAVLAGTTGEISGAITDSVTRTPIAGAQVTAVSPTSTYKATSNSTGFYAIVNVFPDTYAVTASAPDYTSSTLSKHI